MLALDDRGRPTIDLSQKALQNRSNANRRSAAR
jgi:hypothetical protein